MPYIPPKTVRIVYICVLVGAALAAMLGAVLSSTAVMIAGMGVMLLDVIFHFLWYRCPHCGRHLGRSWGDYCPRCGKKLDA